MSTRSASGAISADALSLLGGKARQKMPGQRRDIRGPLAQRRHRDRKNMQPIEQVLAEAAGFDVGDQVAIGGRNEPHVDLDRLARADRLDFAFLDGAQQFDLRGAGNSPTSSRNIVPPEASTNLPTWRSVAPVNEPFSWPNRIDSTRFSGIAPQLTATNGFDRRSPEP